MPKAFEKLFEIIEQMEKRLSYIEDKNKTQTFMTIDEVAEYLNKAVETVRKLATSGTIPSYKNGKIRIFVKEEVEKWLLSQPNHHKKMVSEYLSIKRTVSEYYQPGKIGRRPRKPNI